MWRATPQLLPEEWPERAFVQGVSYRVARIEELGYCSRRRAQPADAAKLAVQPMPARATVPDEPARAVPACQCWPVDAPPRPIHARQTYLPGVYEEVLEAVAAVQGDCERFKRGDCSGRRREDKLWTETDRPEWVRELVLD